MEEALAIYRCIGVSKSRSKINSLDEKATGGDASRALSFWPNGQLLTWLLFPMSPR
jgi:hypothetical protein